MQGSVSTSSATGSAAPEGHDAAMVKRYEDGQAAAAAGLSVVPSAPAAPAPEATPAAPAAAPAAAPVEPPAAPEAAPTGDFVDTLVKNAGLDRAALTEEFKSGSLSDASYAALAAKGYPRDAVDNYLAGEVARATQANAAYEGEVFKATGLDATKFAAVAEWAKSGLSGPEQESYNKAVNSGDVGLAALALSGLNARYAAAHPVEPGLLQGGAPASAVAPFGSWEQVRAEMRKPEYARDSAFRDAVKARLAVSPGLA